MGSLVEGRRLERRVAAFNRRLRLDESGLVDRFGPTEADLMRREMVDEFRRLAPQAPRIGRDGSTFGGNLVWAYSALAVHRIMHRHGGTVETTAELLRTVQRAGLERMPTALRAGMVWYMFSGLRRRHRERGARRSQARRYPGDWVLEMVPGDGTSFDFGYDITECGIVKYLHAHDADELTPWLCDMDYATAEALGYGLERTKTLSWGCDRCDFRLTRHGHTAASWPPLFSERGCGQAPSDT
jgi:hypothetical protein